MADKDEKRGFAGLSDLASELGGIDEPIKPEPKAEEETTTLRQPSQPQPQAASPEPEQEGTSSRPPIETVNLGKSVAGSAGKWILGVIAVIFVIWLIGNRGQSNKTPSYRPPSPSQVHNDPQSKPAPAVQTPSAAQSSGLQYTKPPVGTGKLLSVPEIRWCVRESIRIEAMMGIVDTKEDIDEFNRIVNDYKNRCSRYRCRQGAKQLAERDVEAYRSQIIAEAVRGAKQLGRSYQPSYPSVLPDAATSSSPKNPSDQDTKEVQTLLKERGYDPGPIDGLYGSRTERAIKAFQKDFGLEEDVKINEELINLLRQLRDSLESLHMALNNQEAKSPQSTVAPTQGGKAYSPVEFVRTYYQDVEKHNFESAIAKWKDPDKDKLRSLIEAVDGYHINEISLTRQTSSEAEVYVDVWAKSLKGATERWKGVVFLQDLSGQWVITKTSLSRFEESKAQAEKEPTTATSSVSSDMLVSLQSSRSQSRKSRAKEFEELKKAGFETDWVHDPIYPFNNSQKGHGQAIQNYPEEESYINPRSVESEQSHRMPVQGYKNSPNSSHLKQTAVPHPAIEQPLPYSGYVQAYKMAEKVAPFEIKAAKGTNHLVKLVDAYTKAPVMTAFVRSGTTVNIDVPLGTYEVRYASGASWYGDEYLFGPDTAYSKADRTFKFEVFGNEISGFTMTLYKVANGNLQTSAIKASEF